MWSRTADYVKHGNASTFSTGIQPSIINNVSELGAMCEIYNQPAYKFMTWFLKMQKTINDELCSTPCLNLNSCMQNQNITHSWCAKWEKLCSDATWSSLLGNVCQRSKGRYRWHIRTRSAVWPVRPAYVMRYTWAGTFKKQGLHIAKQPGKRPSRCHRLSTIRAGATCSLWPSLPRVAAAAVGAAWWFPWPAPAERWPLRSAVWLWPAPVWPGSSPLPPELE